MMAWKGRRKGCRYIALRLTMALSIIAFGIGLVYVVKAAETANFENISKRVDVAAGNKNTTEEFVKHENDNPESFIQKKEENTTNDAEMNEETINEEEPEDNTENMNVAKDGKIPEQETISELFSDNLDNLKETESGKDNISDSERAADDIDTISKADPESTKENATETVQIDETVNEVIREINECRKAIGVEPLVYDPTLTQMAQVRASENAANDFFEVKNGKHIRPDGRAASSICKDFEQYGYYGEVMGRYQATPKEIVGGWHNSPSHYACMTNNIYNKIGVGYAQDSSGKIYWVAVFMD